MQKNHKFLFYLLYPFLEWLEIGKMLLLERAYGSDREETFV